MKPAKPSDLELQVLSVLWRRGPSRVRDIMQHMPDGKARAYTSVLSALQVMEKKQLAGHTREGLAHVYSAKVSKRQTTRNVLRKLVDHVFGSPAAVVQSLLAEGRLTAEEVREIQKAIDDQRKRNKFRAERSKS